ncbi:BA75_02747T0 [Komagataella pastoris]|uniref:BA75_02747T0 n=1 Tax=Komagataella pastoris TaxID=4922 RepID=A0A1B2JDF7_PICPA|nr:BA75_02747T0 [Komagataella pastoris]
MEKYTTYRDKGTGISPFLPLNKPKVNVLLRLVGVVIGIVKLLALSIVGLLYPVVPLLSIKAVLFLLNVDVDISVDNIKKANKSLIQSNLPQKGDFVISNYQSPLDPLVLSLITNNRLKHIVWLIPDIEGNLYEYSLAGVVGHALSLPNLHAQKNGKKIQLSSIPESKTVYLFPEGTTSNNKSILPFVVTADTVSIPKLFKKFKVKAVSIKNENPYTTTPIPQPIASYLLTNLFARTSSYYRLKEFILDKDHTWPEIRDLLSNSGRLKLVGKDLSLEKKVEFIKKFR